jgi:dolichyl-diphosphooligosaccharide--protein glycosyltransferase
MQLRLHDRLGSRGEGATGLGHYRALRVSESGEYKAFRVVNGATVQGPANANATVRLSTDVDVVGQSFTYERAVGVENGTFAVTVSYPGEYELDGTTVDSVTVSEAAVINGSAVRVGGNTSDA